MGIEPFVAERSTRFRADRCDRLSEASNACGEALHVRQATVFSQIVDQRVQTLMVETGVAQVDDRGGVDDGHTRVSHLPVTDRVKPRTQPRDQVVSWGAESG